MEKPLALLHGLCLLAEAQSGDPTPESAASYLDPPASGSFQEPSGRMPAPWVGGTAAQRQFGEHSPSSILKGGGQRDLGTVEVGQLSDHCGVGRISRDPGGPKA